MSRIWVFLVSLCIVSLAFLGDPQTVLISGPGVEASTSKPAIVASLCLWAFLPFYPQRPGRPDLAYRPITMWERAVAFNVDFAVYFIGMLPVSILPALWIEAQATGEFQWAVQRDYFRPSDVLVNILTLADFALILGYFYAHAVLGRRTLGQYLLGYRLEGLPDDDRPPAYALNTLLGFVGLMVWPVSLGLAAGRKDKAGWWNLRSRTRLVRVVL